jgi:hypothetical protein
MTDITLSLPGFVTGPNDGPGNGLGNGGCFTKGQTSADLTRIIYEVVTLRCELTPDPRPKTMTPKSNIDSSSLLAR